MSKFSYSVSIHFNLTQESLDNLRSNAEKHYDGVCQRSAMQGGFLWGWSNMLGEHDSCEVSATLSQLGLCRKILENVDYRTISARGTYLLIGGLYSELDIESRRVNQIT